MIFKQIPEILSGAKWQTRRVVKPGEGMYEASLALTAAGNVKWAVGKTYAVVPKRGKPSVWWKRVGTVALTHNGMHEYHYPSNPDAAAIALPVTRAELEKRGFRPLRIRITAIRQERLQDITEADAKAEGVADVEAYRALWQAINGKTPGARWDANPTVFVLEFELVRETQS